MGLTKKLLVIAAAASLAGFGVACGGSEGASAEEPAVEETAGGEEMGDVFGSEPEAEAAPEEAMPEGDTEAPAAEEAPATEEAADEGL